MTWQKLWAIGRFDLHLTEADLWQLTFREFSALVSRSQEVEQAREYNANYRVATILATIVNAANALGGSKTRVKADDFLAERSEPIKPDPDQLLEELRHWNASMGGEEIIQ